MRTAFQYAIPERHDKLLEVLTNETNYSPPNSALAQARLNELLSLVQIYQALGGGWQQ